MNTAEEIIVKLTAQTGDLNAGMDEAAAKVKASTDAMSASVASSLSTFRDLDNIQRGSIKTAQDAAAAQATLTAAQATGAYTTEELAAKQAVLDAAMAKLPAEMEAASAATVTFAGNSRVMGEVSTIVSEAMSGNFGRIRRSAAALANQTGILQLAFTPLGMAIEAVAGSIGILVAAEIEAGQHMAELDQAIIQSGNFAGTTADEIASLAQQMQKGGTNIDSASDALRRLVGTGQVTRDELVTLAQGVVDFSTVTQSKVEEAVKVFAELGKDPVKASAKLNESLNYLTTAQFDQIESLEKEGQTTKAAQVAMEALASALRPRAQEMQQDAGDIERKWKQAWAAISGGGEIAESAATHSMQDRVAAITKELNELASHGGHEINLLAPGGVSADEVSQQYVQKLEAERNTLVAQIKAAGDAAAAQAKAAADVQQHIADALKTGDKTVKDGDEAGLQQLQYAAQQQGHELSLAEEKAYWQQRYNIEKDGGAAEAQNAQTAMARVVEIQKQIDAQRLQSSKEAASKAAEATKQALREQQQAEDQEAQHVQELMRQEAEQTRELSTERAHSTYQTSLDSIEATKASYEEQYRSGQITVQELVALELQLVQQKLAAETNYYTQLKALDADRVKDVIKDQQGITDAISAAARERSRIQMQAAAEELQVRRRTAQEEAQLVASSINQLIFSNQTLKQRLASIGQDILSRFIEDETRKVAMAWASQGQQTAATVVGNQTRVAADQVGQAESLAVQGETAIKWIMTEAAKAAAGAFNAMVSIPYVGPFLAVGASIAAFATVAKLVSNVASAEGGWERVPADGMNTVLHKDEMVLPAHVANPVRDMAKRGGGGGDIHNHFHAADARSFIDMARRRPADLARMARGLSRRGYRV